MSVRDLFSLGGTFTMTPHRSASTNITGYSYVSQDRLLATTIKVVGTFDGESISRYGFQWALDGNNWHDVVLYNGSWTNVMNITSEKNIKISALQGSVYLRSFITRKDYDTTYSPSILYRYNNVIRMNVSGLVTNAFTANARASEINVEDGFQYVLYDPATDEVTGFSEDTKILSVDLSDTDTTELGRNAFKGCSNLETVAFPSTLQEIGDSAFFECSSLTGVDVYNTETIGDYAFSGCSSLETLILGENTSEIGDYAFEYCPSLTDVTSYAVEPPSLGTNNFTASGDTLYVPNEAVSVYEEDSAWSDAFSTIRPLQEYIRVDVVAGDHGTASGSGWYETGDTVVISATADTGYHFLQWNDSNTDNPRTITVGLTDATYTASFMVDAGTVGNTSYSDVTKTSFSASAFFNGLDTTGYGFCYSTTNTSPDTNDTVVTIGNGSINTNATASIINLTPSTTYYVRGFITNAAGTVYNTAITISTDAYTISYTASSEITGTWVDNNTDTSRNTYDSGSGVLYLNAGVTTIGGSASADYSPFYRNSNILTVDLRESNISTIGSHAFQESSVRLVSLPSTLTTIGNSAFYYCGLNEINIPNSVTTIGSGAFRDCLALESVELPSGITSIAEHTFNNTGIVSIEIPAGVTSIGNSAFDYCADLDEVTCFATMPPTLGTNNFTASNDTLYVPYSSIASYNATSPWNTDFEQIRPIGDYSYLSVTAGSHGSVTGGGWYLNGTTAQISATADTHYHFDEWSDGDTNAIRNILVSQDASYTASFEVNSYVITVVAGDHGSATGGGTYEYGTSVQISATPDTDYNFTGWNDGNTDNPRTITVTGDATYTASFAINSYTLTVTGDAHTSVTGSGTYPSGTSVQIEATPDSHYHFVQWSDGNTDNPRTITVTSNITLSASSAIDTHTITVTSDAHGTASGSGTYVYGSSVGISITPDSNYHFVQWNDGNTSNPRSVTVTGDATYSGTTAIDQFTLTVTGDLNTTVTGSGTYDYGTSVQITATPNTHYHFVAWSDGDTNATRTIVVTSDITLSATSAIDTYVVTVTGDANTDTTSGSGTYGYGSSVTISATPVAHYHFARWQDSNTDNPRTITVTSDVTYTATTAIDQHVITTQGDSHIASVTGGGLYDYGTQVTLTATADTGYHFVQWTDGNTDNPRYITVTEDATYRATSALNIYTITVNGDAHTASTTGSGQWGYGSQFQISATPDSNYHFVAWNDGNTDNPRYITVTGDATYTASMAIDTYTLTVLSDDINEGSVSGGGTYDYGTSVQISATAESGYEFVEWNDSNTDNPRTITVTSNATYTAYFQSSVPSQIRYNSTSQASGNWVTNNTDTTKNSWDSVSGDGVLYLNSGVTTIGGGGSTDYSPFFYDRNLTSVDLSDSRLTTISNYAFRVCANLLSLTLPNSLTSIGDEAFTYCSSMTSVTLPNSLTSIGDNAFHGCDGLTSVTIPASVISIDFSFTACSGLASIVVTAGNATYDSRNNCNAIIETSTNTLIMGCKNTVIPNTVTSIGERAFLGCDGLTSVTIPNSVTEISDSAFRVCTALTSITIPSSVTTIGNSAFQFCDNLMDVYVQSTTPPTLGTDNFTATGDTLHTPSIAATEAYMAATNWETAFTYYDPMPSVIRYNASSAASGDWVTNNTDTTKNSWDSISGDGILYLNNGVTTLGATSGSSDSPFFHNTGLTSLDLSYSSITAIGQNAINGCTSLTTVTMSPDITQLYYGAFANCSSLTTIDLSHITILSDYAFASCSSLASVDITSAGSIYEGCFEYCTALSSITFPTTCSSIAVNSFRDCSSLTEIELPSTITYIGADAFNGCTNLMKVTCNATSVPFLNQRNFTATGDVLYVPSASVSAYQADSAWLNAFSAIVPIGAKFIRYNASSAATGNWVTNNTDTTKNSWNSQTGDGVLILNSGVTSIGGGGSTDYSPFYVNTAVTSVDFSDSGLTTIGQQTCYQCGNLTSVTIPEGVTTLGQDAFYTCSSLTNVIIPNSVTTIGNYTFRSCSGLTSVTIGSGVTSIGNRTFSNNNSLRSITCLATSVPTLGTENFNVSNSTLYVPESAFDAYAGNSTWSGVITYLAVIGVDYFIAYKASSQYSNSNTWIAANTNTSSNKWNSTGGRGFLVLKSDHASLGGSASNSPFYQSTALQVVHVKFNSKNIDSNAFNTCTNLTQFKGEGVTRIGPSCFDHDSKLKNVLLPAEVSQVGIGNNAFANCSALAFVYCYASTPPTLGTGNFGSKSGDTLYVPSTAVSTYQSNSSWRSVFTTITSI